MERGSLWSRFRAGDRVAFESVYTLCVDDMYAYGLKLDSDKELVKDCIQEVFIDIYEHRNKISKPNNIKFYILKALKHSIHKKQKKERRKIKFQDQPELNLSLTHNHNFEDKKILLELSEEKQRLINKVLNSLTAKQKEILYLRFNAGFNYKEIAEIIKIDHSSVRKQVYRAIKKIRNSEVFDDYKSISFFFSLLK